MKRIPIIAGPNGVGKTTFATEFLPNEAGCLEFVNADLIAAGLSPFQPDQVAFAAGRLMLERIADLAASGKSFAFETTLATRGYLRLIPAWQDAGYQVKLCFPSLPDSGFAIQRVAQRVCLGGHDIPPDTIRRRFERGWMNLQNDYLRIVDDWSIYDGSEDLPRLLDAGENRPPKTLMEDPTDYRIPGANQPPIKPLNDPDFIGAEAALKRASAKAVARARAAGLEPVVRKPDERTSTGK